MTKGDCFPLYIEVSPVGSCNHRCVFCAYDYIGYPNRKLETVRMLELIDELAECGLRSMLFAGEGEPLLHPDIVPFVARAKEKGIDVGLFTNGQLLDAQMAEQLLPLLTFVRFSFNGGGRENYAAVHSVKADVHDKVVNNITKAVELRNSNRWAVDIGSQFVLLPENIAFLETATEILKCCGVDYLCIKPFMQRVSQTYQLNNQFQLQEIDATLAKAERRSDSTFSVLARRNTFQNYGKRSYDHCFGTSFITVLNSAGVISSCLPYWELEDFAYGSIYLHSFREIWNSEKRIKIKDFLENRIDVHACPASCRPDATNSFLCDIRHPQVKHINFI
ncbi:MAG: radical SAM protein [Geobacteraceae bacterium]|nr:radical SAM protein [Geobacteraceae bacterium]